MPEYGYRGFGIDYAIKPFAWVLENYEPVTNREANFVLLRRRKADTSLQGARSGGSRTGSRGRVWD